jgi:hypothetical protein
MDGRYGAATKIIQKDHIKTIDILLNHQPVNVLRGKINSDNVAINLTLKDPKQIRTSGNVMAGAGIPSQYDGEVAAILLNEKLKMLNGVKANNSSIDYENEILQHNRETLLNQKGTRPTTGLLSSALAAEPDIPKTYYYLNNSELININNLFKTRDSLQISFNLNGFFDRNTYQFGSQINNLISLNDTIRFEQYQQINRRINTKNASLSLQSNKQNAYFSNKTRLLFKNVTEESLLNFNHDSFPQKLYSEYLDISNDFSLIPALRSKNLIQFNWYTHYRKLPQQLNIFNSIEEDVLNNGVPYQSLEQALLLPSFFSNASLSYIIINQSRFKQLYELKFISEHKELQSGIILNQLDGTSNPYTGDVGNNVSWSRNHLQASTQYTYQKEGWQASVLFPVIAQKISYSQPGFENTPSQNRLLINPNVSFSLFLNAEDKLSLNYKFQNKFGDIQNIFQGLMVNNFRMLKTNTPILQESTNDGFVLRYDFKRAIKLLTASTQLQYNKISANTLIGSILSNNIQQSILLPIPNNQSTFSATGELSKYFFKIKSKASLMTIWSKIFDNQIINNIPLQFTNDVFMINSQIEGTIAGKIAYQYSGGFFQNKSFERNDNSINSIINKFERLEQDFLLGYHFNRIFINFRGRQINAWQSNLNPVSFFAADGSLRYSLQKLKSDLSLDATNIFNQKEYVLFSTSSNQFNITNYPLRTRMVIARISFNF